MAAVVGALAVLALATGPGDLRRAQGDARAGARLDDRERLLAPARSVGIEHVDVFGAAAGVIPPNARVAIALGPRAAQVEAGVRFAVPFASSTLMPRRRVGLEDADWVLAYGFAVDELPVSVRRVVRLADGILVAEAAR